MTPHVTWQLRAHSPSLLTFERQSQSKVLHRHIAEPASLSDVTSGENKNGSLVIKGVCTAVDLV